PNIAMVFCTHSTSIDRTGSGVDINVLYYYTLILPSHTLPSSVAIILFLLFLYLLCVFFIFLKFDEPLF
ncbi:MAG: hypothetical protein LBQ34_02135, partial [Alphaproteobacteria bacterium]|nr:hypothetical protein [Alphaproteobacteria bacterium]